MLTPGDPAPWFIAATSQNPRYQFHTVGGRYMVLSFFGSASHPTSQHILRELAANKDRFDGENICFFGISIDPDDHRLKRVPEHLPGMRAFWDFDRKVSQQYGVTKDTSQPGPGQVQYQPTTLILDPRFRVMAVIPFDNAEMHVPQLLQLLDRLPPIPAESPAAVQAPVLIVPRIFEPEFCRALIDLYEQGGSEDSGFMRERDGKTIGMINHSYKKRRDHNIADEKIQQAAAARIQRRLVPEIQRAYQFDVTRMERYVVACYDASTGGYFRAHRDNTTKGTAHRRFAVSINLNAEEFEGGDLRFPEFGQLTYRPPTGGAVVFSCSLLHEATPVTKGKRYAFLPFLYDEKAAEIREENVKFLSGTVETVPTPQQNANAESATTPASR